MLAHVVRWHDHVMLSRGEYEKQRVVLQLARNVPAQVIGFGRMTYGRGNGLVKPGIYRDRSTVRIQFPNGLHLNTSTVHLHLPDQLDYLKRKEALRLLQQSPDWLEQLNYLHTLPPTPFVEGDKVFVNPSVLPHGATFADEQRALLMVVEIDYSKLEHPSYPAFKVARSFSAPYRHPVPLSALRLCERGMLWNWEQGDAVQIASAQEDAELAQLLGECRLVHYPKTNSFVWPRLVALQAIRYGIAHGFALRSGFYGSQEPLELVRYHDLDLGKRIAAETLGSIDPSLIHSRP